MVNNSLREFPNRWKYVDDLSICEVHNKKTPPNVQDQLNELSQWTKDNNMIINIEKTNFMNISFAKSQPIVKSFTINNIKITNVECLKLLGVQITNDLKWNMHIHDVVNRASKRLHMLTCLKRFGMPCNHLRQMYISHIRPVTEYACPVWHSALTIAQSMELESIQKRACRIILGQKYASYDQAIKLLNLKFLDQRREDILLDFAKNLNKIVPNALPKLRGETCGRILRNAKKQSEIYGNTKRFNNSCFPALCRLINKPK
ncbi:uncharacterized protein [Antedon mediterranea]|uniref:uncharacterized protein n=1 Tax=Antedon mediterranea TaxID=105859 RepID=UPI003AF6C89B